MTPGNIKANLEAVRERMSAACQRAGRRPEEVTLIAVTKTVDPAAIETALQSGIRHFGENRVQEAEKKMEKLSHLDPRPTWHLIGHLQSNKIKPALKLFDIIHSIDSIGLAQELDRRAERRIQALLQVNVAGEDTKNGFSPEEIQPAFNIISNLSGIEVKGLMTIAPLVEDAEKVRPVFRRLRELRDSLSLEHLSMGMTDDFEIAIEEGSTMIRIGRAIFGERG